MTQGNETITLFLCGDVMTGRGIDQVLPHPGDPELYEPYLRDARAYVELAEVIHGPIPQPLGFATLWGEALTELARMRPDARIINLETAITTSPDYWPGKGINYRMHPANAPILTAAAIDLCVLANNHVLDWGYNGLTETLAVLARLQVRASGAGRNRQAAAAPVILPLGDKGRVMVFSFGLESSGIPPAWAATAERPGVNLLPDLASATVQAIARQVGAVKQPGDLVIASLHWGDNWGYEIPAAHRSFAQQLIATAGVDLIHGHSSHHPLGIEVYQERLILYGCGDFLNDYEGIGGHEGFRPDLALMYFPRLAPASGRLVGLTLTPIRLRNFQVQRASRPDAGWLQARLNREGRRLGTWAEMNADHTLTLRWTSH